MIPSIGRIVHYTLNQSNADRINKNRAISGTWDATSEFCEGNPVVVGETSVVQGQVFLDGNDTLWVTSVKQGDDEGQWHKPPMTA